jgi:hypothetical protein
MHMKSAVLDVPACEAALNGVDEQQQQQTSAATQHLDDIQSSASKLIK